MLENFRNNRVQSYSKLVVSHIQICDLSFTNGIIIIPVSKDCETEQ